MRENDRVVLLVDPLRHGVGRIGRPPNKEGQLFVEWGRDEERVLKTRGWYDPHELELESVWLAKEEGSLNHRDLQKLRERDTRKH